jgi:hypothetical protein
MRRISQEVSCSISCLTGKHGKSAEMVSYTCLVIGVFCDHLCQMNF